MIGREARAIFAGAAIVAVSTRKVLLERDELALFHAPALARDVAEHLNRSNHLVPENARAGLFPVVHRPIAAADAGCDDAQQSGIRRDLRQRKFAQLSLTWPNRYCGKRCRVRI